MWDRERNSEDELDLLYKDTVTTKPRNHEYLPESIFNPASTKNITATDNQQRTMDSTQSPQGNPWKHYANIQPDSRSKTDAITLASSDEEFDQQLLKKFPICAHLPTSIKT